jgi:5'(3')-deoxyribonucleotidase
MSAWSNRKESTRPFVLGVDIDGVLADYDGAMRDHTSKFLNVSRETIPKSDQWSLVRSGWPFESEQHFLDIHRRAVTEKRMFLTMDPIPGAAEALKYLSDLEVHIRIITFRLVVKGAHQTAVADTAAFLDLHNIPYRDLCFLKDKAALAGETDLLIDDAPHNVESVRQTSGEDSAMVFDQPYNQHVQGLRAMNWRDVVNEVERRLEEKIT